MLKRREIHDHKPSKATSRLLWLPIIILVLLIGNHSLAEESPPRELVGIKGDLYRFNQGHQTGIVWITSDGAVVGDPMDNQTALWLKTELQRQFNTQVKYVFYSQAGSGRSEGGDVFASDGATVVAHQNTLAHLPADAGEASPDIVFSELVILKLGGRQVELRYPGPSARDDILFAYFPDEQAVYTSDIVSIERLPPLSTATGSLTEWFASIDRMNRLPFVYLLDGHGGTGIQDDAIQHGYYLRELHNRVKEAVAEGASTEELHEKIKMPRYLNWADYDTRLATNIDSVAESLSR